MKSTAKTLALGAALLCLLAGGMALPASAAVPLTGTAVSLPWNSDNSVPAESIEAGTYSSNMLLGETQQLSPTVRPRNSTDSVIYLTDDSSVLTVSNSGVVQAVGVGTATVTAAAGNQICAYTISVSMDSTMIVTEMDLALSSNTIYVGNSVSASLQVRPSSASQYATISLTSSNEKGAIVNSFGRVTGVSPGTATITAACGSVTASTTVTVLAIPTEATTGGTVSSGTTSANSGQVITVTPSYVVLKPGATRTLSAKATPASASQSFTYKSGNSSVATVSPSGVITAVGTGSTSITVSNGKATALVTVIVNRSASASSGSDSSNGDDASNGDDDKITLDPTVQTIQDSTDHEVVFAQSEVPVITGDILNSLRTTGKTLCVVGDGYTLQVSGKDVRNTTGELNTSLELQQVEQGLEFVVNDGKTVPCSARIDLDKSDYSRLYLYNETTGKWQYLNSYKDGAITLDTAGRYLLTNENLRFANINWRRGAGGHCGGLHRVQEALLVLVSRSSSSETKIQRGPSETLRGASLFVFILFCRPSFHRHALGEVTGFIHITAAQNGHIVGEELQRHDQLQGHQDVLIFVQPDHGIGHALRHHGILCGEQQHPCTAAAGLLGVGDGLFVHLFLGGQRDHRHTVSDQADGSMLQLTGGIGIRVHIADLLQLQAALQ